MRSGDTPTEEQHDAAALWLAKKTGGSLSATDATALDAWLNADPRHRRAYDDLRILYAQLEAPAQRAAQAAGPPLAVAFRPKRAWVWAGAVPVLAALAIWLVHPDILQDWQADIVTARDIVSTVTLPDGTLAHLGADTALALDFKAGRRTVRLLRGEAYFEVRHGPGDAFTVDAGQAVVKDIGTRFNVDMLHERTEVVVTEGSVEVRGRSDGRGLLVREGSQLAVNAGRSGAVEPADAELALAWMKGRLVVQGARVRDVAAALQRHRGGRILVRGALADQRVSGTFPLSEVDESLSTIAGAVGGTLVHASPYLTILF